ncbi:MAG: hypothetical protein GY943_37665 [Chloroflexi bacterium]|nr:hypothetical protein [Chloroflexota bacterium]
MKLAIVMPQSRINTRQLMMSIIFTTGVLLGIIRFNDIPVGSFFDDAHYLVLAESLATGQGYHLINYPHAPAEDAFPPGWPLLLTPIAAVAPGNLVLPRLLAFACWLGGLLLAYRLFSRRLESPYFEFLMALIVLSPHLIGMAGTAMSESPYLFFSLLSLNLIQGWKDDEAKRSPWLLMALVVTAVITLLIRTIGIALLGSMVIWLLTTLKKRHVKPLLIVGGIILLLLMPVVWFNGRNGGTLIFSSLYSQHIIYVVNNAGFFLRFWEHGSIISIETIANAVVPIFELQVLANLLTPMLVRVLSAVVLLTVAIGYGFAWKKVQAQELYVLFYTIIFYVWMVYINEVQPRIALPLIPFMMFYLVLTVKQLSTWLSRRVALKPAQTGIVLLSVLLMLTLARNTHVLLNPTRGRISNFTAATDWVAQNTPEDALILTANAVPDYLHARRQTINYPHTHADYDTIIAEYGIDYVVIRPVLEFSFDTNQLDSRTGALLTHMQAYPDQFLEAYQQPQDNIWVYQVIQ